MPLISQHSASSSEQKRRLDAVLIAHEFSPETGSECAVGWNLATRLVKYHNVVVLCSDEHRPAVESYFRTHGAIPGLEVVFVDHPAAARGVMWLNKLISGMVDGVGIKILFVVALKFWQDHACQTVRERMMDRFDIIHHLTPIAYWACGPLWKAQKPYCWGPMSGLANTPLTFARWLGRKQILFEALRSSFNWFHIHFSRRLRKLLRKSAIVWTVTASDASVIRHISGISPKLMLDVATPSGTGGRVRTYDGSRPLVICWSGQHINRKALPILLHAVASSPQRNWTKLVVLGGGPETENWKDLAIRLNLETQTRWLGNLARGRALAEMDSADVLVHTSVREATGQVVLEALGAGLPVVCHDTCGMSVAVDDKSGIKVPFVNPERSVGGFSEAIDRLIVEPGLVKRLSGGALRRAGELTWEAKAAEIAAAYQHCITEVHV